MQRVLVAGSTGYIERFVVLAFKKQGYSVRALARDSKKLEQTGNFLEPPAKDEIDEVFIGEVTKPETLFGLSDGIEWGYSYFQIHII